MSNVVIEVACDGCDLTATLGGMGLPRYDLGDGHGHYVETQHAFCHACRSMVDAERLPTSAELAERRAQMMESVGSKDLMTDHVVTQADVDERAGAIERWLSARRSPPRCLVCGSTEIVPHNPLAGEPFIHPGCGGKTRWRGGMMVALMSGGACFDSECRRLPD
jgi:hypothetical protein